MKWLKGLRQLVEGRLKLSFVATVLLTIVLSLLVFHQIVINGDSPAVAISNNMGMLAVLVIIGIFYVAMSGQVRHAWSTRSRALNIAMLLAVVSPLVIYLYYLLQRDL